MGSCQPLVGTPSGTNSDNRASTGRREACSVQRRLGTKGYRTLLSTLFALAASSSAVAVAAPKPPTPSFGAACDPFNDYDAQSTCDPTAKPGVVSFRDFLTGVYPSTGDYGITRACNIGGTSEHKEGRAWDWKVNYNDLAQRDIADTVIAWLLETDQHGNACALSRRLGVMYLIWNKNIWGSYRSPNSSCATAGWKAYTGTNPHTDHVHISWAWPGANKKTSWWTSPLPSNEAPKGFLDGADCERVWGWSQDPDAATTSIDVHLYFGGPAGDPAAEGVPITADVSRDDLCTVLGSCPHGFEVGSPLSLHDGQPHEVHAYGIDSAGGANAELSQSPTTLTCAPVIPKGVRRHVVSPESFDSWAFSYFWDVMPVADPDLEAIDLGPDAPTDPILVRADDGSPEVWLIDGDYRRHVPSPEVLDAWGFDSAAIDEWPVDEVATYSIGPDVRDRPILIEGSGAAVYLMDDPLTENSGGSGGSGWGSGGAVGKAGSGGSPAAAGKSKDDVEGSCACRGARPADHGHASLALVGFLLCLLRRRKS